MDGLTFVVLPELKVDRNIDAGWINLVGMIALFTGHYKNERVCTAV